MPYQEAMSAMAKICKGKIESGQSTINPIYSPSFFVECSLGERQVRESPDSPKLIMREEGLTLDIAVNIPEKPLSAVTYRFVTSAVASDLVQSTFEQYGFPCNKWRSGSETLCYPASLEGSFVAAQLPLDPPYQTSDVPPDNFGAVLKGRPGLWLELLKEPLSSGGVLTLVDIPRLIEKTKNCLPYDGWWILLDA
jgi:hypothetical protein